MFGPDSGRGSWKGLKFMYEKVRVGSSERSQRRVNSLLDVRTPLSPVRFFTHTCRGLLSQLQVFAVLAVCVSAHRFSSPWP